MNDNITLEEFTSLQRQMAWERAKGELRSITSMYHSKGAEEPHQPCRLAIPENISPLLLHFIQIQSLRFQPLFGMRPTNQIFFTVT